MPRRFAVAFLPALCLALGLGALLYAQTSNAPPDRDKPADKDGKATGVSYTDASGVEMEQPARIVIVASWTLNNSRLLLLSKAGEPYDPATGKGTLGKNLTHQVSQATRVFLAEVLEGFLDDGRLDDPGLRERLG